MILIPKHREIILPEQKAHIAGYYKLEAVREDGSRRLLADWFPNLITTLGGNLLGSSNDWASVCCVGSGNNTPALTDTTLQTFIASTTLQNSKTRSAQSSTPYFGTLTIQYNFPIGTATGNLAEIGVGNTTTSLFSRALILDGGGAPTTITVLSSEALYATYAVSQYAPTVDGTGSVTISGTSYSYVMRASQSNTTVWAPQSGDLPGVQNFTAYNGSIGSVTAVPSGTSGNPSVITNNSYSSGSFASTFSVSFALADGNLSGGISAISFTCGPGFVSRGAYQMSLSPAIPKDASHTLSLSFGTSWIINSP